MEDFNLVTISHLQMAGEESAILKIPQEEYEAIVAKYGTKRQFLKYDSNYFDKAQKAAMPEEELSKLYVSHASTEGFEGGLVIFTRFLSMMQEAMHVYRKTFASVLYRKTGDVLLVSKLLGHAKPDMTVQYYLIDDIEEMQHKYNRVA